MKIDELLQKNFVIKTENDELQKELLMYKEFFMYSAITREAHEAIIAQRNTLEKENEQLKSEHNKVVKECYLDRGLCSLCGASQADIRKKYSNYCSNCGAKINELKERY